MAMEGLPRSPGDRDGDRCPYKGLDPYQPPDREFFFGREKETRTIISNLYAAPLTVLIGGSGVGKSSVILAGVVPVLREELKIPVVVFRTWQLADPFQAIQEAILDVLRKQTGADPGIDASLTFSRFLMATRAKIDTPLFLILDQFEEYFLYHPPSKATDSPDAEIARAINQSTNNTNILLSLRDDGISKLDRFRGRIANPLANLLRLERLTLEAARDAILKPLEVYNGRLPPGTPPLRIEEDLVADILDEVEHGKVSIGETGRGGLGSPAAGAVGVETPFLQIVLTRVWRAEREAGSSLLRRETFLRLGRAKGIVRGHLDESIKALPPRERDLAARVFRYLVTPSGTKIAYGASDLAKQVGAGEKETEALLGKLSGPQRIIRAVCSAESGTLYEIFHDVLAKAILEWSGRHLRGKEAMRRWLLRGAIAAVVLILLALGLFSIESGRQARQAEEAMAIAAAREAEATAREAEAKKLAEEAIHQQKEADEANGKVIQGFQDQLKDARKVIAELTENKEKAEELAKKYLADVQQKESALKELQKKAAEQDEKARNATKSAERAQNEAARAKERVNASQGRLPGFIRAPSSLRVQGQ